MNDPHLQHLFGETERRSAEEFLASAGKGVRHGFDLNDPAVRAELLKPNKRDFIEFQIVPLPEEILARIKRIPSDWQEREDWYPDVESLNRDIEAHFQLLPPYHVSLNDRGEAWVYFR